MYSSNLSLFGSIYCDKKVLVTGNTGFKGLWLLAWLVTHEQRCICYLSISTKPSHFAAVDLKDKITDFVCVNKLGETI